MQKKKSLNVKFSIGFVYSCNFFLEKSLNVILKKIFELIFTIKLYQVSLLLKLNCVLSQIKFPGEAGSE